MDVREIGQLTPDEEFGHWWMRTRFLHLEDCLVRAAAGRRLSLLETGCGTGQNLRFLLSCARTAPCVARAVGLEPEWPAGRVAPPWLVPPRGILVRGLEEVRGESFDFMIAMDVLEHLPDDAGTLRSWLEFLSPGARVFVTVPALPALWSAHDEALGHKRRYTAGSLRTLAASCGLRVLSLRYIFLPFLLPAFVARKLRRGGGKPELRKVPAPLNALFYAAGALEARLGGGNPWLGMSLAAELSR
jgi:SAM-dependent methyltransferase